LPEVVPSWNVTLCTTPPELQFQVTVVLTGTVMVAGLKLRLPLGPTVTVELPSPPEGALGLSLPEQPRAAMPAAVRIRRRCLMGSPV
jgi:hypothetical protein